jgi:pullulanase/glycogen debranching enzyme
MGPFGRAALNYFSPNPSLASDNSARGAQAELKRVVTALHGAGIEVIVQFEFCFTVEGTDEDPRAMSFRGIDSAVYYRYSPLHF